MTVADLAIIAGLVFAWGTLSARLERFDMTAPIVFTAAGVLLTHGPLTPLGITPSPEVVKVLAEVTLALVLFSDASRVGLHQLRRTWGCACAAWRRQLPADLACCDQRGRRTSKQRSRRSMAGPPGVLFAHKWASGATAGIGHIGGPQGVAVTGKGEAAETDVA